jgi:hypothetical protein
VGERDVPAAGPVAGDPVGLHPLGDGPREAESHPADLGYPYPTEPAVQTLAGRLCAMSGGGGFRRKSYASPVRNPATPAAAPFASRPPANRIRRGPPSTERTARGNRACADRAASAAVAQRPDSTHIGRGDNAPPTPPPAQQ